MTDSLHILDYLVVFSYLAFSLGLGLALRRQSNRDDFFSAGRSMGRLVVGLSVMATLFSANSFVMYPATAYGNSLRIWLALVAFWAMGPLVAWVFIPVYARFRCATAYEYLEHRFHVSVRCLASTLFILLRIAWMAAATFAASVAIAGISGVDRIVITIGLGVVAIVYTMMGGLRAVMWTDVLQFFVFFGTILFTAAVLIGQSEGGASQIISSYFEGRDHLWFDFSLDPTLRFGSVAILLGSFFGRPVRIRCRPGGRTALYRGARCADLAGWVADHTAGAVGGGSRTVDDRDGAVQLFQTGSAGFDPCVG